jgi:hypothetical protein
VKSGAYQYVLEAHENGGCHCHIIYNAGNGALPDNPLPCTNGIENAPGFDLSKTAQGAFSLMHITEQIANVIKKNWKGGFVMRKVQRDNLANMKRYFLKSVGSDGHVETALDRMSKGYNGNGGDKKKRKDIKLLKTFYFSTFYGIKTTGYSKAKKEALPDNPLLATPGATPAVQPITAGGNGAVVPPSQAGKGAVPTIGGGNTNASGIGVLTAPPALPPHPAGASPAVQPITAGGKGAVIPPSQAGKRAVPILGGGNTNASGIGVFLPRLLKQILIKSTVLVNLVRRIGKRKPIRALPDNPLPCKKTFTLPRWVTDSPLFDGKTGEVDRNSWLYGVLMAHGASLEPKAVTVHHSPLHRLLKRLLNAFRALINRIRRIKP